MVKDGGYDSYDAMVRKAVAKYEAEGIEAALGDVLVAKVMAPEHPALLALVDPLFDAGERKAALEILGAYCGQHPEDELVQIRYDDLRDADAGLAATEDDDG